MGLQAFSWRGAKMEALGPLRSWNVHEMPAEHVQEEKREQCEDKRQITRASENMQTVNYITTRRQDSQHLWKCTWEVKERVQAMEMSLMAGVTYSLTSVVAALAITMTSSIITGYNEKEISTVSCSFILTLLRIGVNPWTYTPLTESASAMQLVQQMHWCIKSNADNLFKNGLSGSKRRKGSTQN